MRIASKCLPQGGGLAAAVVRRAVDVALDWGQRQKSRLDAVDAAGERFAIFLPRGTVMRGGDVLVLDDGSLRLVDAAPQPVMVVRLPKGVTHSARELARAAYHLGNRHVAVDVQSDHLKIEPDTVLADMLRGLHFDIHDAVAPFEPEGGAYASTGGHGHEHEHGRAHDHAHTHDHAPASDDHLIDGHRRHAANDHA